MSETKRRRNNDFEYRKVLRHKKHCHTDNNDTGVVVKTWRFWCEVPLRPVILFCRSNVVRGILPALLWFA